MGGLFKHQGTLTGGGERRATGDDLQCGEVAKEVESLAQPLVMACQHVFKLGLQGRQLALRMGVPTVAEIQSQDASSQRGEHVGLG